MRGGSRGWRSALASSANSFGQVSEAGAVVAGRKAGASDADTGTAATSIAASVNHILGEPNNIGVTPSGRIITTVLAAGDFHQLLDRPLHPIDLPLNHLQE